MGRPLRLSGLGVTFQSLKKKEERTAQKEVEVTNKDENEEFSQDMLELQWLSMCNRMPKKMIGLASRMKNVTLRIIAFPEIEIVADNQLLLDEINNIKGRIRATLALALHNGNIQITLRLAAPEEIKKRLTKKEVFDELAKQKEFAAFVEAFGLQMV